MCLNLPFEVKNQLTFYKVRWFKYTFCYSVYSMFSDFLRLWNVFFKFLRTLSLRRPLSYRNQPIDFFRKSVDWLVYDNGLRHERVKIAEKWRKILSPTYSLKFKNIILFLNRCLYIFFKWSYSQHCFDVA